MFIDPAFKELWYENCGPDIKPDENFIFGPKGKEITEKLAGKKMVTIPIRADSEGGHFFQWYAVMRACCNAYYDRFGDRTKKDRVKCLLKDKEIESQIVAIKKLQKFYKENWDFLYLPARQALETLTSINKDAIRFPQFTQFLDQYATGLEKRLEELVGVTPLSEKDFWPYGGLLFPGDRSYGLAIVKHGDIKIQSLLFHLVFIFRHITSNNMGALESFVGPMPTTGKPCYSLVADIADIVFKDSESQESFDEMSVRKIVDRLVKKNVHYFDPDFSNSKYTLLT